MEFSLSFSTSIVTIFSIVAIAFLTQILTRARGGKRENKNPPQAKGAWPIIGHLHLLGGSQLPHVVFARMAETHGPIFTVKLGVHQILLVSDPEMAKECFTSNDKIFASRPKSEAVKVMGYNYAMFGFAPYGEYWRQMRKITMIELLSQRRVEMLGHIRVSEIKSSLKDIYEAWVMNKKSENSNVVKVEMKHWFGKLILNTIVKIISGKKLNEKQGVKFHVVSRKFFELMGTFVVSDFLPFLKFLDLGGHQKAMKMTTEEMDGFITGWLEEHRREWDSGQQEENQVFLNVLSSHIKGSSENDFYGVDRDTAIKASCLNILAAGSDSTTVTLTWALSLMLNNPKTLELVENELDEHVGRERLVDESDVKNLIYLQAVIKETLRLYPPAPLSGAHESMENCIVGGYNIPKGTRLLLNLWKMHHDPNIWSDPYEFQPERFLTGQKNIDIKGKHFELLPFGSGRRMCAGMSFALQAVPLTLASLIQQFSIKKPSNEPIDMSESFGLTSMKVTPLEVLLTPRLSPDMYPIDA